MPRISKEMDRLYHKHWYRRESETIKARIKARRGKLRLEFEAFKSTLKCSRCPENHPAALDFHHLDPSKKDFQIGSLTRKGYSMSRLMAEVAKCEVLCSNCHRKLEYDLRLGRLRGHSTGLKHQQ